jgi:hypothetical protein
MSYQQTTTNIVNYTKAALLSLSLLGLSFSQTIQQGSTWGQAGLHAFTASTGQEESIFYNPASLYKSKFSLSTSKIDNENKTINSFTSETISLRDTAYNHLSYTDSNSNKIDIQQIGLGKLNNNQFLWGILYKDINYNENKHWALDLGLLFPLNQGSSLLGIASDQLFTSDNNPFDSQLRVAYSIPSFQNQILIHLNGTYQLKSNKLYPAIAADINTDTPINIRVGINHISYSGGLKLTLNKLSLTATMTKPFNTKSATTISTAFTYFSK